MKVVDIANEIYVEMGQPTDNTLGSIAFWIRAKVGDINNLLFECFKVDPNTLEITADSCEISPEAVAIIKKLYKVYYYDILIRGNLTALGSNSIILIEDQGQSIQRVNRNEIMKTLASLKKDELADCNNLINAYRIRKSSPSQVAGDDTQQGVYENSEVLLTSRNWIAI